MTNKRGCTHGWADTQELIISSVARSDDVILAATETDLERDQMWLTISTRQPLSSSECWPGAGSGRVDIRLEHFGLHTRTHTQSLIANRIRAFDWYRPR